MVSANAFPVYTFIILLNLVTYFNTYLPASVMKIAYVFKNLLLLAVLSCIVGPLSAQTAVVKPKPNWQNLDLATDGMFGISTESR
jgi:hypothetical protein